MESVYPVGNSFGSGWADKGAEMRKRILGLDVSILAKTGTLKGTVYADNAPFYTTENDCVVLGIMENNLEAIEIAMDKYQTKAVIKGLKMQLRRLKD